MVMVRTRLRADLDALRDYAPGSWEIVATPDADYPYRAVISRATSRTARMTLRMMAING